MTILVEVICVTESPLGSGTPLTAGTRLGVGRPLEPFGAPLAPVWVFAKTGIGLVRDSPASVPRRRFPPDWCIPYPFWPK